MNFTKVFSLFALLVLAVLSVSAVSAAVDVTGTSTVSSISGTQVTFNLNVTATPAHSGTFTNAQLVLPNLFGASTSWTGDIGTFTLNPSSTVSRNVILSIPIGQTPGPYTGLINFTGTYSLSIPPNINALPITLTVTSPPTSSTNLSISVSTTPFTLNQNATLTVSNSGSTPLSVIMSEFGSTLFGVSFVPSTFSLSSGSPQSVQTVLSTLQNLKFGFNTVNVQATSGPQVATASFQIKKTFCSAGESTTNNISISNIDWSNNGEGDENEWELLDEIEVEVEVANNDQDDDHDIIIELGLYDVNGKNVADDLTFTSESDSDDEEIDINIDEDDDATVTFVFKVPADFDTGNYRLAVKAYNDDTSESRECDDSNSDLSNGFFQNIDVKEASDEQRFVVVDEINADSQVTCGQVLTGQFTIFNIGDDDQDRVKIIIQNDGLNIDESIELTSDLDQGDEETLDFSVQIPSTASNGVKQLEFITQYDYKNGVYREESQDSTDYFVEVIGCSQNLGNTGSASGLTNTNIEAELSSEAIAGQELIVTSTITNTGTTNRDYTVDSIGYSEWAELTDISDESFSLDAGESKEIVFKFLVSEDSSGTQAFDIQLSSEGKVQVQEVEVELAEASKGFSLDLKGNSTLWIIGLVNVVLILLIIVVAVRLSRK